jgi:hypothetical protein
MVSCLNILDKFILFRLQNSHSFSGPRDKTYLAIHYSHRSTSLCDKQKESQTNKYLQVQYMEDYWLIATHILSYCQTKKKRSWLCT